MTDLPPPSLAGPTGPPVAPSSHERRPTHRQIAEQLIDRRSSVGAVAVHPDGSRVAFVVATIDLAKNSTLTRVWLDDSPVTNGEHDGNPSWSPDRRFLAFTSRTREKKGDSTLRILPVDVPGEVRTVCTMPDGLGDVAWSPDGRWIAFTSRNRHERYEAEDPSWQAPRKIERFFSRLNGEDWIFDRPNQVYVVAADGTGVPRSLTPGEFQHHGVSWLRDSTGIVTSAQRHDTWDRDHPRDLYVVALTPPDDGDGIVCLTAHDGHYVSPSVSPDGSLVAFVGFGDPSVFPQNAKVGILPIDGVHAPVSDIRWISAGFDRTFETTSGSPSAGVGVRHPPPRHRRGPRGATHLYRMPADGSFDPCPGHGGCLDTITSFDAAAGVVGNGSGRSSNHTDEFYVGDRTAAPTSATSSPTRLLDWEHFTARTTDGTDEIDAWIMRPADFDQTQRYPVLLNVHGGPHKPVRRALLRQVPDAGRCGLRRRPSAILRRQRTAHRLGPGHPRPASPPSSRVPAGAVSMSTTCSRSSTRRWAATTSVTPIESACSGAHTADSWQHGSPSITAISTGHSVRNGRSTI